MDSINLINFLAYVYDATKDDGFVSWKDYKADKSVLPSSHVALEMMERGDPLSPVASMAAREAIMYVRINSNREDILALVTKYKVPRFKTAQVALIMQDYLNRDKNIVVPRIAESYSDSEWVGRPGDAGDYELTGVIHREYGKGRNSYNWHVLTDKDGNSFTCSSKYHQLLPNHTYIISARIGVHDVHEGVKQTKLTQITKIVEKKS